MFFRLGGATSVFGWLLILSGIAYLVVGVRGAIAETPGSLPRVLVGLLAVVIGSSIVRWALRSRRT
jgi:uncharacterized membrane protein HdeD (DUF308 family)